MPTEEQKARHTPGPWKAAARQGDDWDSVVAIPGTPLEICQCFHERGNEEKCEANARLIAAAPELLEALKQLLVIAEQAMCAPEYRSIHEKEVLDRVDRAIAKAEGAQ